MRYNYATNYFPLSILSFVLLCFLVSSCKKQPVLSEAEITKKSRNKLGTLIQNAIQSNSNTFPLISETYPPNVQVFNYFNTIYKQAYFTMRHDINASVEDSWDKSIDWKFHIIDVDEKMAFCLPGGDFYITFGLLDVIRNEHQLFYIMTFEALLMNERKLIAELSSLHNPLMLNQIIQSGQSSTGTTPLDLAKDIFNKITYSDVDIKEIDIKTIQSICDRSTYEPTSINEMVPNPNFNWYQTRPTYHGRRASVIEESTNNNCGHREFAIYSTTYKRMVEKLK